MLPSSQRRATASKYTVQDPTVLPAYVDLVQIASFSGPLVLVPDQKFRPEIIQYQLLLGVDH